ncbi:MAG: hypothetical protein KA154_14755 [Gemmatimonadaceae bacterium]|nr:hypothetical protein [Gemmatimonadaceae bacterium]
MTLFSSLYTGRLDRELGTDDSTVLFLTARRKAAVNEGQAQFADLTECLQRTATIGMRGGSSGVGPLSLPTAEYDLMSTTVIPDGDFVRFSKDQVQFIYTDVSSNVTILAGDDLPRRDVPWLNRFMPGWQLSTTASSAASFPEVYYQRHEGGASYLGFWPTPSTGPGASAQAVVPYVAAPTPLTSDTQEPFTVAGESRTDLRIYHQALVHYAAAQLEKLRRDTDASDRQMQLFLSYVQRYTAQARKKGGHVLTTARAYFNRGR